MGGGRIDVRRAALRNDGTPAADAEQSVGVERLRWLETHSVDSAPTYVEGGPSQTGAVWGRSCPCFIIFERRISSSKPLWVNV